MLSHSLSVSVCPCLSEIVCAHTFCMRLHCFDMLSCPDLQLKTANSSSWGGIPTSFFLTQNACSDSVNTSSESGILLFAAVQAQTGILSLVPVAPHVYCRPVVVGNYITYYPKQLRLVSFVRPLHQ